MSPHTTLRSETGSPCEFQEPFTREKSVAKSANERAQRSTAMAGVAPLTRSPPAQRRDPGGPRSADQVKVPPRPCAPLPWRRSRRRGWCSEDGGVSLLLPKRVFVAVSCNGVRTGSVAAQGPQNHLRRRRSWPVPQWVVYQLLGRRQAVRPTQVGRPDRRGRIWHVAPCHWCMAWAGRRCSSCRPWR